MTKHHNVELQILAMRSWYPCFKIVRKSTDNIEFVGDLVVKPELPTYTVSITYRGDRMPAVKIISPPLVKHAKHIYFDTRDLCLYHRDNYHWNGDKLIAKDIVPWVATWIYFYEVWLQTGVWYGPEVPHNSPKVE